MTHPTKEWLKEYENIKPKLMKTPNLNSYFNSKEVKGIKIDKINLGEINIPTGEVMAYDPLVSMNKNNLPYIQKVPKGKFPLTLYVAITEDWGDRYAAAKVDFTKEKVVRYELALKGDEDFESFEEGYFFGFPVDAGLGTILDLETNKSYCDFIYKWDKVNPEDNIYDGLFSDIFKESQKNNPKYQRDEGDWIMWTIPNTNLTVPMFATGFGDGIYPVYFGYDKEDKVANLVVHLIDIENELW